MSHVEELKEPDPVFLSARYLKVHTVMLRLAKLYPRDTKNGKSIMEESIPILCRYLWGVLHELLVCDALSIFSLVEVNF